MHDNDKTPTQEELDFARLQNWDVEIEADFRRTIAKTKSLAGKRRGRRLVAFPWAYLVDVCRLTEGRTALIVAAFVYRRVHVCNSRTVTLPNAELAEVGVNRSAKHKALLQLAQVGVIRIEPITPGHAGTMTLLWGAP
jgi:hypothetical protein